MILSVLVPTIPGREAFLAETVAAFEATSPPHELLTITGRSWGAGLNELARVAAGDYWLFACDDTAPLEGWFRAGRRMVDEGLTPASRYFHPDGSPLHQFDLAAHGQPLSWSRSWLLTPERYEAVGPLIDTTWWADIDYSERVNAHGWQITACDGFSFTHLPSERTWLTPEEEQRQRDVYEARRERGLERVAPW